MKNFRVLILSMLLLLLVGGVKAQKRYKVLQASGSTSSAYLLEVKELDGSNALGVIRWFECDDMGYPITDVLLGTGSVFTVPYPGNYTCTVNDMPASQFAIVECTAYAYKLVQNGWATDEICHDSSIDISVERVSGVAMPEGTTYQWYLDGNLIPSSETRITGQGTSTISTLVTGTYSCVVTEPGDKGTALCNTISISCEEYPWLYDDNTGNHNWFDQGNWYPNYNRIPVRTSNAVMKDSTLAEVADAANNGVAVAASLEIPEGSRLVIKQTGRMGIDGELWDFNTDAAITLENGADGYAAFTVNDIYAYVNTSVYGYAESNGTYDNDVVWQYMAVPVATNHRAEMDFYGAWITKWTENTLAEDGKLGANWSYITNSDKLKMFEGYALTQNGVTSYPMTGEIQLTDQTISDLSYTGENVVEGNVYAGYHLLGNSFTAPIDVAGMQAGDFVNMEKAFYLFNYGSWNNWEATTSERKDGSSPGQYTAIPLSLAQAHEINSLIPSMQGFFVFTKAGDASVTFDYLRTVHNPNFNMETAAAAPKAYAPRRNEAADEATESPVVDRLTVLAVTESYVDGAKLFVNPSCSDLYDDGWDGRKMVGNTNVPQIYFLSADGKMQYNVSDYIDGQQFEVAAGKELTTTIEFNQDEIDALGTRLYLHDLTADTYTDLTQTQMYTFTAARQGQTRRFCLTSFNPNEIPAGNESVEGETVTTGIYDMLGRRVNNSDAALRQGVYVIMNPNGARKEVVR